MREQNGEGWVRSQNGNGPRASLLFAHWAFGLLTGPQVWARIEYSYLLRLASIEKLWMLLHSFFFACDTIQR